MKDFEELLDGVLREDASAQPRTGLEGRVMARVRAEQSLPHGLILQYWNRWRRWLFVPAAACLGIIAVWCAVGRGAPQPARIAARVSAPVVTTDSTTETKAVDGSWRLGGSVRPLRDAHLRRDKTATKMGHPAVLRKRDVFPSPAPAGTSLAPVGVGDARAAARELSSAEAVEALLDLRREQAEPVRVSAIQIAPLRMDEDGQQFQ